MGSEYTWRLTVGGQPLPKMTYGNVFDHAFGISLQVGSPSPDGIAPLGGAGEAYAMLAAPTHAHAHACTAAIDGAFSTHMLCH